jgi:hypothetical protein
MLYWFNYICYVYILHMYASQELHAIILAHTELYASLKLCDIIMAHSDSVLLIVSFPRLDPRISL